MRDSLARDAVPASRACRRAGALASRFAASPFSFTNISLVYVWAATFLLFSLWVPDTFLTSTTWRSLASEQAVTTILALSAVVALASGVFDLSLAAVLGASAIWISHLVVIEGISPEVATLVTLASGVLVGAFTGVMVVVFRVNAFIATLGVSSILTAFIAAVSNYQQIIGLPASFQHWVIFTFLDIQGAFWIAIALAVVIWFVLDHRPAGRYMYATGGNPDAARLAGVRTDRVTFLTIVCSALIATVAGIVVTARLGTGSPTIGPPYLLPAYAAAFLGSTQIKPGRFNVWGTVIAVYALATGVKGLQLAGAQSWLPDLFNGAALLVAVALSVRRRRLSTLAGAEAQSAAAKPPPTLREAARRPLEELRGEIGESVRLSELTGDRVSAKVIAATEAHHPLRVAVRPGELLAPDSADVHVLSRGGAQRGDDPGVTIREAEGVVTLSAPVEIAGEVRAAVSVCAPAVRLDDDGRRMIAERVAATAGLIAENLRRLQDARNGLDTTPVGGDEERESKGGLVDGGADRA